ncbi:MAG TPA: bifunctional phosphoribosylaminoimidazolecarboxamide formyltransferase/IMP cyclohydrolase PurH [Gemmatimonas aurantiaca]|uniref:Bifunctional purine biosynthesis protein PurH n=2 Tax=Gemmatimonas aurantiaca TaxID=173480 RepID=C1A7W1_GEMAT|nr:bifunctional phosphoribosylaminoimidazolecarboxamide formyltransferase/IMP cyclohydrolase [Gemmatimonas aurantiaca]BAH38321.1 phosphoribosylaminoimidazolecarboxamide formyltransferase/IMP cyclohydrolase [Gemmatimonas aurantiaca T-27]HCT57092.1 bifunctional phosphoribosylaminoimidazolecarboxamide formyltransferase/IMP cyclohydrolase PurH [Gemmatimonas aurantiaca]
MRALLSVSDKSGLLPFAQGLVAKGVELVSTGGTARMLRDAGLAVKDVSEITGFPEMLDGRVKTLHPVVHGGLLARRDLPEHMDAIKAHDIGTIDLVVVNLYPFRETAAKPGVHAEEVIENIDIGGPSMLRSAAKNFTSVWVIVDPSDYAKVLDVINADSDDQTLRTLLAEKVYAHTSGYDAAIAQWFAQQRGEPFPDRYPLSFEKQQSLRYGENPQQRAAFYVEKPGTGLGALVQRGGKELSFNNLLDLEGSLLAIEPFGDQPACAIIKHTTPCGLATGTNALDAYKKALACDPVSAFGSVIAFSVPVDVAAAEAISSLFVECIVAPKFADEAVEILVRKKNLRVLEGKASWPAGTMDLKRVRGGLLVQDRAPAPSEPAQWQVVSSRQPTSQEQRDLLFAWKSVASVKSNAIVLVRDGATIGIGAGQMSRVDASFVAVHKATSLGHATTGSALGSDAFFPFRDGIDQAAAAGVTAIVQPGGSVRDAEVIAAANEHGIAMVFTGERLFRH